MKITSEQQPTIVEKQSFTRTSQFLIRFNIIETDYWEWEEYAVNERDWNKEFITTLLIHHYYSDKDIEDIVYNVIQNPSSSKRIIAYKNLLAWREQSSTLAQEFMEYAYNNGLSNVDPNNIVFHYNNPKPEGKPEWFTMVSDGLKLLQKQALTLTDEEACDVPTLFPAWTDKIGEEVLLGERLYYNGDVWKVQTDHTVVEENNPYSSPDLYIQLSLNSGTKEYPIPKQFITDYAEGTYYLDGEKLYFGELVDDNITLIVTDGRNSGGPRVTP